jgi:hypothetical protein
MADSVGATFGLLASAVLRPQNDRRWRGCVDHDPSEGRGTAVSAAYVFYALNGWQLDISDEVLFALALDAVEEDLAIEDVARQFAMGSFADPPNEDA